MTASAAGVALRPLTPQDRPLLVEATLANVNWCGPRFAREDVEATPALRHYCDPEPERGDWGYVGEVDGQPAGVVWLVFLPATDPGYGFVAEGVPELSICVFRDSAGRGVGRTLMAAALADADRRAPRGVSLSVESGNSVRQWYERLGFAPAGVAHDAGTLLRPVPGPGASLLDG